MQEAITFSGGEKTEARPKKSASVAGWGSRDDNSKMYGGIQNQYKSEAMYIAWPIGIYPTKVLGGGDEYRDSPRLDDCRLVACERYVQFSI